MPRLLNRASWDAGGVRNDVRGYVIRHLGDAGGVLVVDETGFVKRGPGRRGCSGSTRAPPGGWRTASWACSWPVRRRKAARWSTGGLYLPKSWTDDPGRCREAGVPDDVPVALQAPNWPG